MVKISVCIPAYKNADYLRRCLDSLVQQTFKDFEVVLSDDSPDDSVLEIAKEFQQALLLKYFRNSPAKGTPANWNFAMDQASGAYIKLIHDDDWLATPGALQTYLDCLENNPAVDFCFSAYNNVYLDSGKTAPVVCSSYHQKLLQKDRYNLFKVNFIGPPSAVFQRNNGNIFYDEKLKWLVDFEGYTRFLEKNNKVIYLDECLVNIGLSGQQVTASTKNVKEVVIPESMYFLEKHGVQILKNIWVYDYYWRMFRNLGVKDSTAIEAAGWQGNIPGAIVQMLHWQRKFPGSFLQMGPVSKLLMGIGWIKG